MYTLVHPRTRERIADFGIDASQLDLMEPLPYIEFLALQRRATVVVTDSGGIQEETTYLKVPCLTLRNNPERPVTVTMGTNILVGQDGARLRSELGKVLQGKQKQGEVPPLWDGHAGERIAEILSKL
jgi:UDP-N-acetylglucosamine 2-epimerase (non-hydrolysing)